MRHPIIVSACLTGALFLTACDQQNKPQEELGALNVIDESNLNQLMLTAADPNESVAYFQRASIDNPDRLDLRRGLALSLVRAGKAREGAAAWENVIAHENSETGDQIELADAYIRLSEWDKAEEVLDAVPPTYETFKRYRLEAMVADSNKEWTKADSFYDTAVGLTTQPAGVLNNWGYSKLTRGDFAEAEKLFGEALRYDPRLFTAKNNLVLARGAQRNYSLPVIDMTQIERAQLLHTMALAAIKQGDTVTGKNLLQQAIDTHPQHFEDAVRALRALEGAGAT